LSSAKIGTEKVIPGMQKGELTEIAAIASRSLDRAQEAAKKLGIPKVYGSYEDLLADPDIDAVYNPLPNHLHVPWSIKALNAGKHVLCEKPIALSAEEAELLIEARDRTGKNIVEAFMVRHHPQWIMAKELVDSGEIGELRAMQCFFSYFNRDPENIRNNPEMGGGGIMDIGVYPIVASRFIIGAEPIRVVGLVENDPEFGVDRLASAILEFPEVQATFTCSTQCVPYQRVHLVGTTGRVEIEIPWNAPQDTPCRVFIDDGSDPYAKSREVKTLDIADQYHLQGDAFSRSILENNFALAGRPIEDAVQNMRVVEAIFRSAKSGAWVEP
jgi:predicted dehydrogenase